MAKNGEKTSLVYFDVEQVGDKWDLFLRIDGVEEKRSHFDNEAEARQACAEFDAFLKAKYPDCERFDNPS